MGHRIVLGSIAQREEQEQREPESAGEFREGCALVGGKEREAGKDCYAAGQRGGGVIKCFKGQRACGQAGCGEAEKREDDGRESSTERPRPAPRRPST